MYRTIRAKLWGGFALVLFAFTSLSATELGIHSKVLVVKLRQSVDSLPADSIGSFGSFVSSQALKVEKSFPNLADTFSVTGFPADRYVTIHLRNPALYQVVLAQLRALPMVESAEPDYELSDPDLSAEYNDPKISKQWFLEQLKVAEAWETTKGDGQYVADVESGFDTEHPDLKGRFDLAKSHDYDPETDDVTKVNDNKMSHGTPVCGLIGAGTNNGLFGAGIAHEAWIIGSQMANTMAAANEEPVWTVNTATAILGSIQRGASVILIEKQIPSLLSSVERIPVIYDAIKAAVAAGVPVVVPAGNFSKELKAEAALEDTGSIFVSATTKAKSLAYFSNYGARINVSAPGEEVYSIQEQQGETYDFGGTSSASAITAGIVALVRAANPALTPREIRSILVETAVPLTGGMEDLKGFGLSSVFNRFWDDESAAKKAGPLLQAGPAVLAAVSKRH